MGEHIDPEDSTSPTKLQHALEFVRIKLAQRLINPKKTDQIAVVLFGGNTDNQLAEDKDGYEHIQELISMRQPSYADLRALDRIKLGKHSADMIAAMYVAGNLVRTAPVRRKDARKQVVLLTDAQEIPRKDGLPVTDWDDTDWLEPLLNAIIPGKFGMPIDYRDLFSLGVMYVVVMSKPRCSLKWLIVRILAEWTLVIQTLKSTVVLGGRMPRLPTC